MQVLATIPRSMYPKKIKPGSPISRISTPSPHPVHNSQLGIPSVPLLPGLLRSVILARHARGGPGRLTTLILRRKVWRLIQLRRGLILALILGAGHLLLLLLLLLGLLLLVGNGLVFGVDGALQDGRQAALEDVVRLIKPLLRVRAGKDLPRAWPRRQRRRWACVVSLWRRGEVGRVVTHGGSKAPGHVADVRVAVLGSRRQRRGAVGRLAGDVSLGGVGRCVGGLAGKLGVWGLSRHLAGYLARRNLSWVGELARSHIDGLLGPRLRILTLRSLSHGVLELTLRNLSRLSLGLGVLAGRILALGGLDRRELTLDLARRELALRHLPGGWCRALGILGLGVLARGDLTRRSLT